MTKPQVTDDIFEAMLASIKNPRLKQSLGRVKEACDFLEKSQAAISPTSVGSYCSDRWKGPKTQSIRNSQDTLFRYLQTRMAKQVLPVTAKKQSFEPVIRDETVRAYVTLLKTERDEAIGLKNRIIAGLRSLPGIPIDDLIASGFKQVAGRKKEGTAISNEVREALSRLFTESNLASVGLELYRERLRHATTKKVLLEKLDVQVLLALIRAPEGSQGVAALPAPGSGNNAL